jgi:hypothetical protein
MPGYVWGDINRRYLAELCHHSDQDFIQGCGRSTFGELATRMNRYYFGERYREGLPGPWDKGDIFNEIQRDLSFYGRSRSQFDKNLTLTG